MNEGAWLLLVFTTDVIGALKDTEEAAAFMSAATTAVFDTTGSHDSGEISLVFIRFVGGSIASPFSVADPTAVSKFILSALVTSDCCESSLPGATTFSRLRPTIASRELVVATIDSCVSLEAPPFEIDTPDASVRLELLPTFSKTVSTVY